jgi:hypothetical protein
LTHQLKLPDGQLLSFHQCQQVIQDYKEAGSAIIDFYDATIPGPHDLLSACDIMSLIALNPWTQARQNPMGPMTRLWENQSSISGAIADVPHYPVETLSQMDRARMMEAVARALVRIQRLRIGAGQTVATKLLHRLRPNAVPIWDEFVGKVWYPVEFDHGKEDWLPWLSHVYNDVTASTNLACLQELQKTLGGRVSLLRTWDIVLWKLALG